MHRYAVYSTCLGAALFSVYMSASDIWWLYGVAFFGALAVLGTHDLMQRKSSLLRNYPILGHFRYRLEAIGPEMRQYFIESDTAEVPFSRQQRALVYQRAKSVRDTRPFGTQQNVYAPEHEWLNHSLVPVRIPSYDFRVIIGGSRAKPYSASLFNISAMSFGSLSANAILALNEGASRGGFYHDTGEGSISPYHLQGGGDLVWEIGSGYFGCRDSQGRFDPERFAANARLNAVRMIEIKLSQGAKPGHGGVLPGAKVSPEIAATRGVRVGEDCVSPASHSEFTTPLQLLSFVDRLRDLSGGKPVGFKLAVGHPWEWFAIAKAMAETGVLPDFIVVDGAEGGTGTAPAEFLDHVGLPLQEGLLLVHNTLVGLNLRSKIRIGAAGKIVSAFDMARTLAMGADWCNAGRGFMFALGCIQALSCHTDRCPTGVATQDPKRTAALNVPNKATRVYQFHQNTLRALRDLLSAVGVASPEELRPYHVLRRISQVEVRSLEALYQYFKPGELLTAVPDHSVFRDFWHRARSDSFALCDSST